MPSSDLTLSDRKFLEVAVTCFKEPPELDVPKMMELLGIKHKSVTNKWGIIKKKLWGVEAARAAGEKTQRKAASAAYLKRKRDAEDGEDVRNPPPQKTKWYGDVETGVAVKEEAGAMAIPPVGGVEGATEDRPVSTAIAPAEGAEGVTEERGGIQPGEGSVSMGEGTRSASVGEGSTSVGNGNDGTSTNDGNESC